MPQTTQWLTACKEDKVAGKAIRKASDPCDNAKYEPNKIPISVIKLNCLQALQPAMQYGVGQ